MQQYYDIILSLVPIETKSLIDVGSGYGIFGYILSRARNINPLISIDPFDYKINHYNVNHKLTWQEWFKDFLGEVDVIVSTEMIEHMSKEDAILFLKQAKTRAKKVIIATPFVFENQKAYDDNKYQIHCCVLSTVDFIRLGYNVMFMGVFNMKGISFRLYYNPKWNGILKLFGIKPSNIIGVYQK